MSGLKRQFKSVRASTITGRQLKIDDIFKVKNSKSSIVRLSTDSREETYYPSILADSESSFSMQASSEEPQVIFVPQVVDFCDTPVDNQRQQTSASLANSAIETTERGDPSRVWDSPSNARQKHKSMRKELIAARQQTSDMFKGTANYVLLPFPAKWLDDRIATKLVKRWSLIQSNLKQTDKWSSINDFITCIINYNPEIMNTRLAKFTSLLAYEKKASLEKRKQLIHQTLPFIAQLALSLEEHLKEPLHRLDANTNGRVTLTQQQCAALLACQVFCVFDESPLPKSYPTINLLAMYSSSHNEQKLRCIFHYFERIRQQMPVGRVTFERRAMSSFSRWETLTSSVADLEVEREGRIEDTPGTEHTMVDFANMYIGGGVIGGGCVQEEILFVIYPECLVAHMIFERMLPNEAIVLRGVERFSDYSGYGHKFYWAGDHIDRKPRDQSGHRLTRMTAIDAKPYGRNASIQFSKNNIDRELNKAFIGFSGGDWTTVSSGNWGCGAFGGDKYLKALIQLVAASHARKKLLFYTFDDKQLEEDDLNKMTMFLKSRNVTIGLLYSAIVNVSANSNSNLRKEKFYSEIKTYINAVLSVSS